MATTTKQYCTFRLGGLFLGVDVLSVQEVIRFQRMTPVPLADPVVQGLINLRGQIIVALDLRKRMGLPPLAGDVLPMNVVIKADDGIVSLLVDEIGDVIEVDSDSFELPPDTLRGVNRELILGVYKLEGELLHILNTSMATMVPMEVPLAKAS